MGSKKTKTKKMWIYTLEYCPFVMGGSVWQPVKTEWTVEGSFALERGYKGYLAIAPNGTTYVIEGKSGALIGPSIEEVKKDVKSGNPEVMKEQIANALKEVANARIVEPDEFWRKLKCLK